MGAVVTWCDICQKKVELRHCFGHLHDGYLLLELTHFGQKTCLKWDPTSLYSEETGTKELASQKL